jgi:hypothetical protein
VKKVKLLLSFIEGRLDEGGMREGEVRVKSGVERYEQLQRLAHHQCLSQCLYPITLLAKLFNILPNISHPNTQIANLILITSVASCTISILLLQA